MRMKEKHLAVGESEAKEEVRWEEMWEAGNGNPNKFNWCNKPEPQCR
jgi:hypothetical protein